MKRALVEAMMHDLKGANYFKVAEGVGGTWPVAVCRAIVALSKQKGVSRKQIKTFNMTVSIGSVAEIKDEHSVSTGDGPNKAKAT